jgi:O-antigen ligase
MLDRSWLKQLYGYALCILAFFIPFNYIYSSIATGLVCFLWLLQVKPHDLKNAFKQPFLLLWLAFYGFHILGYFNSTNKDHAAFDLQVKMGMVLFPIVLGSSVISNRFLERVFFFFNGGVVIAAAFSITRAYLTWKQAGDPSIFFYHKLVDGFDANAVYMAWYTIFSIAVLLFHPWQLYNNVFGKCWRFLALLIQTAFLILLSSRLLVAVLFLVIVPLYLYKTFRIKKFRILKLTAISAVAVTLIYYLTVVDNPIKKRFFEVLATDDSPVEVLKSDNNGFDASQNSNLNIRLFIWKTGIENMAEHNLWLKGAGNGDVYELQNNKFREHNVYRIDYPDPTLQSQLHNINMHNMFLQCLLMIGVPGLLIFILISFGQIFSWWKLRPTIDFYLFHIIAISFMMQEAALQSQAGNIFYVFFYWVLWRFYRNRQINNMI